MRTTAYQTIEDCTEFRQLINTPMSKPMHATILVFIASIAALLIWLAMTQANLVVLAEGRVRAISAQRDGWNEQTTHVASESGGTVESVFVNVGGQVSKGDPLLSFETKRLRNELLQLKHSLATKKNELQRLQEYQLLLQEKAQHQQSEIKAKTHDTIEQLKLAKQQQKSAIRVAKVQLDDAQDKLGRVRGLHRQNAASDREFLETQMLLTQATEKLKQAEIPVLETHVDVLRESLEAAVRDARVQKKATQIRIDAKHGELKETEIEIDAVQLRISQSNVVATTDGVITQLDVKPGDVVLSGKVGISIVKRDALALVVEVSSADVARLEHEMPVKIKLDAFDYRQYGVANGKIQFVAPDSHLSDDAQGRQLATYQVMIRLSEDHVTRGDNIGKIKLGMIGIAEIVLQRKSLLSLLLDRINGTISLN
ncbi:MAG: HlyD family efflux transporter periplasmic adaptor subunit [Pirellulaceae bacterium]|nr:HlyD family efflux transporter periplasmic adaptor subunit [Pirellulaceae bacterium]